MLAWHLVNEIEKPAEPKFDDAELPQKDDSSKEKNAKHG